MPREVQGLGGNQAPSPSVMEAAATPPGELAKDTLVKLYEEMVRLRRFDRRSVALQRSGRIGTYPPLEGQEACQVGSVVPLRNQDFIFPTYRDYGAMMLHGVPMHHILLYWNGRAEGCVIPPDVNVFPISVPIATQLPHAAGAAWAAKLRGADQIAVGYFGDGASSEGDFHEAMNFAGVFNLPVVYFCQNNQYAISVPFARQTATQTIAEKAQAYGLVGERIDGNDVIAVYQAMQRAMERARSGQGATLIEALTYRHGPHTTSDDPTKYRARAEEEEWLERDPVATYQRRLREWGMWSDAEEQDLSARIDEEVAAAIAEMEAFGPPNPADLFQHVYEQPTARLLRQQQVLEHSLQKKEGGTK